jgi:hypothetical protein
MRNHLLHNRPIRPTRLFGLLFAFPLRLAAGIVAPDRGALFSSYERRSAPLGWLRQLIDSGPSCRMQFVPNWCWTVIFSAIKQPNFLRPMEENIGDYPLFGIAVLKRLSG